MVEILDNTGTWMPRQVRAVVNNLDKQIEQLQRDLEKEQTRVKAQKLVIVHLKDELAGAIKDG